jgi:hypothetical protein
VRPLATERLGQEMAMDRRRRRDDESRQRRLELYMAVRGWLLVAIFLVGGIVALTTGHPGSGQAGLAISGACAALLLIGRLRSQRRHRNPGRP